MDCGNHMSRCGCNTLHSKLPAIIAVGHSANLPWSARGSRLARPRSATLRTQELIF